MIVPDTSFLRGFTCGLSLLGLGLGMAQVALYLPLPLPPRAAVLRRQEGQGLPAQAEALLLAQSGKEALVQCVILHDVQVLRKWFRPYCT